MDKFDRIYQLHAILREGWHSRQQGHFTEDRCYELEIFYRERVGRC